ncbi:type II toxin-antitoxin system RelE/ParE family toxin [Ethanoligenens harbinense]|uniref:Plasmid stabilization system n=1 Tax=Ethanoligenens harbinense (strain DSM 18485 / JCM 12961 / CGMCC 1.5033 / YUAN-3) TaxID=663278 RepID=E6U9M9_ETHHY|nr:type II toxin-antitoxin system RelE/ParE family toxin [Ethanoligenens harbinense]ADU27315.1 plasmid stabilization system [Ethanoligenens harbinense YUAN-3]AVQ96380.1 type II toxin-antitoxin system RelE/ParE family toxin [Ethanoligenens harbinense YUAN-3]AYF39038.1 type II toxin-antitoxin system RelE/ParE family toxin [Ethanoligenens harbinense]AYF41864.1 type II toxin-antitoxin system RelE/ParE family toxin [Ethanoligenens harbinense]QCN92621.1 type II toxin-antitoxin system RelE/ParE famil
MSQWQIVYTEQAARDLRGIHDYIAFTLLEPEIARKQTRRILDAVATLDEMPLRCPLYEKEPWRGKGLRVLPVDRYLAFYLPMEPRNTVAVIRVMYGGRNLEEQLKQTDLNV